MKDKYLKFPCGCKFPYDYDLPYVNGKPSIIYDPDNDPFTKEHIKCTGTWGLIGQGKTKGGFQLESNLGQHYSKKLKPDVMEHLSALGSILRPGCLQNKDEEGVSTTDRYIMRKLGVEPITYKIQALAEILDQTYGMLVYQEQAIMIAMKLAGFTEAEADSLRKAIGKKLPELMAKIRVEFIEKAKAFGVITEEEAISIFDEIEKSQRYQFNKAHSWAYAETGYMTMFTKFHFPLQFFTSYLYFAKDKQDPLLETRIIINDAKDFGFRVETPRFTELPKRFKTNGVDITFGLSNVKGIGEKQVDKVRENARLVEEQLAKPKSLWSWYKFLIYMSEQCTSTVVKRMIEVGGLRTTGFDRQLLLHEYNTWVTLSPKEQKNIIELTPRNNCTSIKESLAILLDMEKGIQKTRKDKVSSLYKLLVNPPTSLADSSSYIAKVEEENLGISVSCSRVDSAYKMDANCTCHQYKQGRGERDIVIACEITDFKEFKVKNGDNRGKPMCKMTVSDKSGSLEVVCFSKAYEQCGGLLYLGNTVELVGRRNDDDGYVVEGAQQV